MMRHMYTRMAIVTSNFFLLYAGHHKVHIVHPKVFAWIGIGVGELDMDTIGSWW